ncbi:MAG: AMP-binding protein [Alphaproteobacteria bacterium]|nr:AMP-binding protein [Alphaproteobacteria bacterium]
MTGIHPKRHASLGQILDEAFHTFPSDTACIEVDRERELVRLTFAAFRAQAWRVAAWLEDHDLTDGARVGVLLPNQAAWLLLASAVFRVGGVVVPLDPRLTPDEQATLLRHAGVRLLVTDLPTWRKLDVALEHVVLVGSDTVPDGTTAWPALTAGDREAPAHPRGRDDLAAIVYSSGTGGPPKGCMLSHGNYLAQYQALMETFPWARGDRYLSILPTNHAIDFMCGFIASFCTGTTVVWQRTLRPELLLKTFRRYRITQTSVVPMILAAFDRAITARLDEAGPERKQLFSALTGLNAALTRRAPRHDLSRWLLKPVHDAFGGQLRILYCGGAFTPRELAERFADLGLPVAIGYGLTEAGTVATVNDLRPFRGDTVGTAVPGVEVRIADPDASGVGEVQLRGPTVFLGYLDDPEQTEAAFDDGWLRTGDLGWLDGAHHLHLVGRRKNMIVTAGGKNVYPEDVEAAFDGAGAEELAVMAWDYLWPRGTLTDEQLVVVARATDPAAVGAALARANRALPEFKRIRGVLWWDETFPRTPSLKLKRAALADAVRAAASADQVEALS